MESKDILLKCKTKKGLFSVVDLTTTNNVHDLKVRLSAVTGINIHKLKVFNGYPPKQLDMSDELKKLCDLPIASHETLIVEEAADSENIKCPPSSPAHMGNEGSPQDVQEQVVCPLPDGVLVRYVMPSNNSCLFSSICLTASQDKKNMSNTTYLREIIAESVAADRETYNDAFLGQRNEDYCAWIRNEEHWGGAIEISILSKHFALEIVSVDLQNMCMHRFGENYNFDNRIFLVYNGVHYDALAKKLNDSSVQTIFPVTDEVILNKIKELAAEAKLGQPVTEIKGGKVYCTQCDGVFQSQAEIRDHALKTQHTQYTQEE